MKTKSCSPKKLYAVALAAIAFWGAAPLGLARAPKEAIAREVESIRKEGKAALQFDQGMQSGNLLGPHIRDFAVRTADDVALPREPGLKFTFALTPGPHYLQVVALKRDGVVGGAEIRGGISYLNVDMAAGKSYRLTGMFGATSAYVWLEDTDTSQRVSDRVHVPLSDRFDIAPVILVPLRR